jgi:ABC-type antimicrobial peptide transport system permease subunit
MTGSLTSLWKDSRNRDLMRTFARHGTELARNSSMRLVTQEKLVARLTLLFGLLALALAAVGLYGVTAYTVAQRGPEIGIRMALGAERGDIVWMVLRGAILQAGVGMLIGVPVALLCARYLQSQLFSVI